MALQISMLEEAVQRLHVRLQRAIRTLYVLHSNGNDEAAAIALQRVEQINTKIAELHALLDSYEADKPKGGLEPQSAQTGAELVERLSETPLEPLVQDVVIDDPDQDDLDMEYRGAVYMTAAIVLVIGLMIFFFPKLTSLFTDITTEAVRPSPPTQVEVVIEQQAPPIVIEDIAVTETTYTVQKGDSLWKIAQVLYGDGNQWTVLYGQNVETIGDNPDLIFPGQVLTITKVSTGTVPVG